MTTAPLPMDLQAGFRERGYALLRGAIPLALIGELRQGVAPILAQRGAGGRTGTTRNQTLLEPASFHPSFRDFLDLEPLNRAAEAIAGSDRLVFAGLGLLVGSPTHGICPWHRDFPDTHPEVPELRRDFTTRYLQTNCAIYHDASLWIVPRSHARAATGAELAHATALGASPTFIPIAEAEARHRGHLAGMPGAEHVVLGAGDCLIYNPLIWHAAEYRPEWTRATLHGGWRVEGLAERFAACRWGLDHNPWLREPAYLGDPGRFFGPQLARYNAEAARWAPCGTPMSDPFAP